MPEFFKKTMTTGRSFLEKKALENDLRDAEQEIQSLRNAQSDDRHTIEQLRQQQRLSEGRHAQDLDRANRAHNRETSELKQKHQQEIRDLHSVHNTSMAEKESQLYQERQDAARQVEQLREDIESLNAALLTNDDDLYRGELFTSSGLPAKPDDKISTQFSAIEQMVDDIGRLQWKRNPAVWTNEVLNRIHGDRMMRKDIVKDLVWSLLYSYIFSSPFRVFQNEGRSLEMQWSRACGQEPEPVEGVYKWPPPAAKTERWRYLTIKECRDALRPPVPSDLDPRSRLRKGFTQRLDEFDSAIRFCLGNIVTLPGDDEDVFGRLFRKAASVWLEFAAHRCRIVVGMQGPANLSSEEKVAMAQSRGLKLTAVPSLGRYGNVMGTDLDSYKAIDKCTGKSTVILRPSRPLGVESQ